MTLSLPLAIPLIGKLEGNFYPLPGDRKPPMWLAHIEPLLNTTGKVEIQSEHASGLFYIRIKNELVVITFGSGWQKLESSWVVPDFGRSVVLNSISNNDLVGIRAEQVMAGWHIADERAPVASNLNKFSVKLDRDLVSAIEGRTNIEEFGEAIRGGTSLRIALDFEKITRTINIALARYSSGAYKRRWPEIDNLSPVHDDEDLILKLDNELDFLLSSAASAKKITLATPLLREGLAVTGISYVIGRFSKSSPVTPYLTFDAWSSWLTNNGKSPNVTESKSKIVHVLDHNSDRIKKVSIYECFGCEVQYKGFQYILSSGQWYKADTRFIAKINDRLSLIKEPDKKMPAWDGVKHEGEYNEFCMKNDRSKDLYDLDAKCVHYGGGHSKFEFCDLFSYKTKSLYFAKIPTKSSDCSHLFEQTRRTVELFFGINSEFRTKLQNVISKYYSKMDTDWLDQRPDPREWQLCLVLLGKSPLELPFFARCGLFRLINELESNYHDVRAQTV